jgi:LuxR family maltose regulon positive regulatory protein
MPTTTLATKLYVPPRRPKVVLRPGLVEQLNRGLQRSPGVTLVSAPAGFGKTTLVSEWAAGCARPVAWLSLDQGDNDPTRFLVYFVAALQTIAPNIGKRVIGLLQSPQPPPSESILTILLNEISNIPDNFVLVLDDYHVIDSKAIDGALSFLIEHLPPQMHMAIATREDPGLPLARLRARGQLTELRVTDLRFSPSETAEFLNQVMDLNISTRDVAALEMRTEGWIAGLQLAAISMRGQKDVSGFIKSFTGSHHFVMDYLVEEVLTQQSEDIQDFLLYTSILDRLCGPLCDALLGLASGSGQSTLEFLEQVNLFIIPLDNERRWYRYHHLFADLLKQRLSQSIVSSARQINIPELHIRASAWYEDNDLEVQAFEHAAAAQDFERAERLIEGKGMPLHFRGAVAPVLNWLETLPTRVLDAWPSLWTAFASTLLVTGQTSRVEGKLQAAEAALKVASMDDKNRDLTGRIAAIRATSAASQNQVETIIAQSQRALEYLHPANFAFRTSTAWKLGFAYHLQGDRVAARQAYTEVVSNSRASGNMVFALIARIGLGTLQEGDNQLHLAAQTYQEILQSFGEHPLPFASEVYFGLARLCYEWNDLDDAHEHVQKSLQMARQIENNDRFIAYEVFLARLQLARGDAQGASATLAKTSQFVRQHGLMHKMQDVATAQVLILLHRGNHETATNLIESHELPLSRARVQLALGNAAAALALLDKLRLQMEEKGWEDELLKVKIVQVLALTMHGNKDKGMQLLSEILALTEPQGFIRLFIDEGPQMMQLLSEAAARGIMPDYTGRLLKAFEADKEKNLEKSTGHDAPGESLIEPLSERELEVLKLIAQGLSNQEISERLFLALSTVKGHNLRIFGKLQVQRRTEAVARARELGLV